MQMPFESLSALQAFVHAADLRSFKAAGQKMGITSSGIGKIVQKLEEQLSARLFHRTTRSITLTEQGRLLLDSGRRILAELETVRAEITQSTAEPRGRLKVSVPVALPLFTPLFGAFLREHPGVELDLDINERLVDVIEEGYDVVLRTGEPRDSRLQHRRLGVSTFRLVAAPAYLARMGVPTAVHELSDHRCLRHRYPETGKLAPWPFAAGYEHVVPPSSVSATLIDALTILAEDGDGIAALPNFLVDRQIAEGRLVEVLPGALRREVVFVLLWPATRYPQPKVRAFVDFAAEWLRDRLE